MDHCSILPRAFATYVGPLSHDPRTPGYSSHPCHVTGQASVAQSPIRGCLPGPQPREQPQTVSGSHSPRHMPPSVAIRCLSHRASFLGNKRPQGQHPRCMQTHRVTVRERETANGSQGPQRPTPRVSSAPLPSGSSEGTPDSSPRQLQEATHDAWLRAPRSVFKTHDVTSHTALLCPPPLPVSSTCEGPCEGTGPTRIGRSPTTLTLLGHLTCGQHKSQGPGCECIRVAWAATLPTTKTSRFAPGPRHPDWYLPQESYLDT